MRLALFAACVFAGPPGGNAQDGEPPAPEPGRPGDFTVRFTEPDPRSDVRVANRRLGKSGKFDPGDYNFALEDESFDVHVPADYDGTKPFGLIAWISSNNHGGVPRQYVPLMRKHRLIWIGANGGGNGREPHWIRAMLAIDAVFNMVKLYRIDPQRIYVAGVSGGGRMASMVAPPYPDVFTGGACYVIGCNPIRHIPIGGNRAYPGFWHDPDPGLLAVAKKRRYVLLTGSDDYNKPGTKRVFEAYRKDGFPHLTYLEEPGLGHAFPSPEWFEKAILALDEPLKDPAGGLPALRPNPVAKGKGEYRTWTSGEHTTRARFAGLEEGIVTLRKPTGEALKVPLEKLGPADRRYVEEHAGRK